MPAQYNMVVVVVVSPALLLIPSLFVHLCLITLRGEILVPTHTLILVLLVGEKKMKPNPPSPLSCIIFIYAYSSTTTLLPPNLPSLM